MIKEFLEEVKELRIKHDKAWRGLNELENYIKGFINYEDFKKFNNNIIEPLRVYILTLENKKEEI